MRLLIALAVVTATAATAFEVRGEAGPTWAARRLDLEAAVTAAFPIGASRIELRPRAFVALGTTRLRFEGAGLGVRYRTPPLGNMWVDFTLAAGLGAHVWVGCVFSDLCGGIGGFAEASPTVTLHLTRKLSVFWAFNGSIGFLLRNSALLATIGATIGLAFDFIPVKHEL